MGRATLLSRQGMENTGLMIKSRDIRKLMRTVYLVSILIWGIVAANASLGCLAPEEEAEDSAPQSWTIGAQGGVVEVTDPGSAIYGAKVYIPPDALSREQDITITLGDIPQGLPNAYRGAGGCINFMPDGATFETPVMMYLPYVDTNNDGIVDGKAVTETQVGVLYFNETTLMWEEMDLHATETDTNRAVIFSEHFSTYLTYIDPVDAQPYDTGATTTQTGDETAVYTTGDCYLDDSFDGECNYYFLTITRRDDGLLALVDRNATYTTNGYPTVISDGYDSATFDASSAFARVLDSGDASAWIWEAEFVREHTYLRDYVVEDDPLNMTTTATTDTDSNNIYCRIEAEDANMVRITWQIDLNEQIVYPTHPQGGGHILVVKFRAFHQ